jgi:RNA polymerase sigma factor (sigma-70 family)
MSAQPSADWNNSRLVEQCLAGNEQAWHALLDRYKNLIYSIPLRYGAPQQDAADIFQLVCLDLFNQLPQVRDAEALPGWLIRVTTNKCYHWKQRQLTGDTGLEENGVGSLSTAEPAAADVIVALEKEQMVREAIGGLPPRCRELISLLFFEHPPMPYDEVARRLRLAKGSIGFIRGRCLKRMKKILEGKGF